MTKLKILPRIAFLIFVFIVAVSFAFSSLSVSLISSEWKAIPTLAMKGDLKLFWHIGGGNSLYNSAQAKLHGFEIVNGVNTYADYPGKQKENINNFLKLNKDNPWLKPSFFERIVKQNLNQPFIDYSVLVNDIEFSFNRDIKKAWNKAEIRDASQAQDFEEFREKYYREIASWYTLPLLWSKQINPEKPVGVYGRQVFNYEHWGFKSHHNDLDKNHYDDLSIWKYIDPFVDFRIVNTYLRQELSDPVYHMASNIEENYLRGDKLSIKPLYTYFWLKYYPVNGKVQQEVDDYLAESAAVIPFFTGAKGIVLWGWEPSSKGQPYRNLPVFMKSLSRVARLSDKISHARLIIDQPAHVLWKSHLPLIRKLKVSNQEWIVMAINPWQKESDSEIIDVDCGGTPIKIKILGKHTEIYHLKDGDLSKVLS
jgi:hypothetical protein